MKVLVHILFKPPTDEDWDAMHILADNLTNNREGVLVFIGEEPGWIVAEFTMPNEAKYKAVEVIDHEIRMHVNNGVDTSIQFPRTAAERARDRHKAERRKTKRSGGG
jgi:hypothetical protein